MRIEIVLHRGCPPAIVEVLEGEAFREKIMQRVVDRFLHGLMFGPAEFYIEQCRFAVGGKPMCDVRLTGVSITSGRSTNDYINARAALENCCVGDIEPLLGGERMQLMATVVTDGPPWGMATTLIEGEPVWLGKAEPQRS